MSQDTWDGGPDYEIPIEAVLSWCREVTGDDLDGVTISGGEPFEQPQGLGALVDALDRWRKRLTRKVDFLCYSGFGYAYLRRHYSDLLQRLDALIPGPYIEARPIGKVWRGSDNQSLVPISRLGKDRYSCFVDSNGNTPLRFQVSVRSNKVWFIGIPDRRSLAPLESHCAARGLELQRVSWRS